MPTFSRSVNNLQKLMLMFSHLLLPFVLFLFCLAGIQKSGSKYISVYQARKNIGFQDIDQYYKRGMPYTGKVGKYSLWEQDSLELQNVSYS